MLVRTSGFLLACMILTSSVAPAWSNPDRPGATVSPPLSTKTPVNQRTRTSGSSAQKTKVLIFDEGSDLEGSVVGPNGEQIQVAPGIVHTNMIRVRMDFLPEIYKTAEDM